MIDEKKLIDFIDAGKFRNPDELHFSENDVVRLIKNFAELSNELKLSEQPKADWIPCEERLPELDEGTECFKQSKEYLVTVQWWDKETNIDIGWYNQNGMWSNDSKNCKVIAWQPRPLPQPYKKEGAE